MDWPTIAFWAGVAASCVVWWYVGRDQWFIRDDWGFLITRQEMLAGGGWDSMLMIPQDGHWMAPALLVFHWLREAFGYGSYWPYLIVLLASHLGIVLCARALCRRLGVQPWTTTLMCGVLLVLGYGWENLLFAVQITYNFSLLAFLAQVLLADHDGPVDWRDGVGAALAVVGVMSSGFGPFFIFGIAVFLGLRRRWTAMAVAVVPQALAYAWWWVTWGADPAADEAGRAFSGVPRFTVRGMLQAFGGLSGTLWLAGGAALLTAAILVWRPVDWWRRSMMLALAATPVVMYAGIGVERAALDAPSASASRYAYMAAMMLAPMLALGLDQAGRFAPWAVWVSRALLVLSIGRNVAVLDDLGGAWAARAREEQRLIALIAGSGRMEQVDPLLSPLPYTLDVRIKDIPDLVARNAVEPRQPATPEELAAVEQALRLSPVGTGP